MKNHTFTHHCWAWIACLLCLIVWTACDDNEDGSGAPVIHSVRMTDPDKADSTFTEASPGQMIVVQGENLDGAREVYINNQSVGFNSNYNTSTHLICTIPSDLELVGANPEFPAEIRLVTPCGTATYAFYVLSPAPSISRYEVDLTLTDEGNYEVVPGQELVIHGSNFYDVERVYLSETDPLNLDTIVGQTYDMQAYEINSAYNQITVHMPLVVFRTGWLVVQCRQGIASYGFSATVPAPELIGISSDMPVPGTVVTLYGRNLLEVQYVDVNGEYTIPATDLSVSPEQDEVSFLLPTTPQNSGKLGIVTMGGRAEIDFYPYELLVLDFDTTPAYWSWGDHQVDASTAQYGPKQYNGNYYGVEGTVTDQWWWGNLYFAGVTYPTALDGNTPVADIDVRFECYQALDVLGTTFTMKFCELEIANYAPVDYLTGDSPICSWFTCSIPLSSFTTANTYADFCALCDGNFNINTRPSSEVLNQNISVYFDNFRFVRSN